MAKKAFKRANGTGSVYKLGGRRRRPWVAVITHGKDSQSGKMNRITLGYFAEKNEAESALQAANLTGVDARYNFTLAQTWGEVKKRQSYKKLSASAQYGYNGAWKRLAPLHNEKIRLLKTADYQAIVDDEAEAGLSRSALDNIKVVVSKSCTWAMENDLIDRNYSQFIEILQAGPDERIIFTDAEIKKIYAKRKEPAAAITLALLFTGMRPGELLSISNDENLQLDDGYLINGSKTAAGRDRVIPICATVKPIIRRFADEAKTGSVIFTLSNGTPIALQYYRVNMFYPLLDSLGIMSNPYDKDGNRILEGRPKYTPYTCRHTFASLSNRAGVNKDTLQKAIGHVVGSNTIDKVYIHQQVNEYKSEFGKLDLLATVLATAGKTG